MSDVLLSVEHLAATYDQAIRAVSDVSFSVPAGGIVAVLGAVDNVVGFFIAMLAGIAVCAGL
ncbi:MAG: hypothetical protein E6833_32145, partial [Bradyrhizobium sp.]|nr:hypothetical protein [Bradyrhizobium sp.]